MSYSVVFSATASSNYEMTTGASRSFSFSKSSGSLPPSSATFKSASASFSKITVYTSQNARAQFGDLGTLSLDVGDASSQSGSLSGTDASAALGFTGGNVTLYAKSDRASGKTCFNIRSGCVMTITITYDVTTPSTGSLSTSSVMQGNRITMTISKADSSFTHKITWQNSAGVQSTVDVGSATSSQFTVPSDWATGTAKAILYTYNGSNLVGSNTYSFTVTIDGSKVFPTTGNLTVTMQQSEYVPASWGIYVKNHTKAYLALPDAQAGTQATISNITFTCGSQSQSTTSTKTWTTNPIAESGTLSCTGQVTNSFGNTTSASSSSILVYDYTDPQIGKVVAFRCKSATDSTPEELGNYIAVTAQVAYSSVNSLNSLVSLTAQYKKANGTTWSTGVPITNNGTTIIGDGLITGEDTYEVRIIAIDQIQNLKGTNSAKTVTALIADSVIHVLNGGLNVSFGMEGSRQNAIEINPDWDIWHGDTMLNGPITGDKLPFKIKAGLGTVNGSSSTTVYFSNASVSTGDFSSAPMVVAQYATTGSNVSGDPGGLKICNITASSFTVIHGASGTTNRSIEYIAVGT